MARTQAKLMREHGWALPQYALGKAIKQEERQQVGFRESSARAGPVLVPWTPEVALVY